MDRGTWQAAVHRVAKSWAVSEHRGLRGWWSLKISRYHEPKRHTGEKWSSISHWLYSSINCLFLLVLQKSERQRLPPWIKMFLPVNIKHSQKPRRHWGFQWESQGLSTVHINHTVLLRTSGEWEWSGQPSRKTSHYEGFREWILMLVPEEFT